MSRKIAIKKLTDSDLTFFQSYFRSGRSKSKQKAINLNADVFKSVFYPDIDAFIAESNNAIPVQLNVYGPGVTSVQRVARKVIKGATYKNFRLDGELLPCPEDDPGRYRSLRPGDFALFEFEGAGRPSSITMILIAKGIPEDQAIHAEFEKYMAKIRKTSMMAISEKQIEALVNNIVPKLEDGHPISQFVFLSTPEAEAAAMGVPDAQRRVLKRVAKSAQSLDAFQRVQERQKEIGQLGEELVYAYLEKMRSEGKVTSVEWVSRHAPLYPYDFEVVDKSGRHVFVEVKTTAGGFSDAPMRFSFNELLQASQSDAYHIYRVFELQKTATATTAKVRIARGMISFATKLVKVFLDFPEGVQVTHVAIYPRVLEFEPAFTFSIPVETSD